MTTPRVLVTGATGWLGTSLVDSLTKGISTGRVRQGPESIRVLTLPGSESCTLSTRNNVHVMVADLRDPRFPAGLLDGIDTIFHCAGIIHAKRVADLYATNVDGTRNLLEAAIRAHVRRFILVSSNSPAGLNSLPTRLMLEDDPPRPYLSYGLSKLQSEWLVRDAHSAGRIQGVIVRGCWFYGPHQPSRQTKFFRMIKSGHPPVIGKGDNLRSMSYIDNVIQGLLLARDVDRAAGQTYWIADRRPYSLIEILEMVAKILGVTIRPRYVPRVCGDVARLADSLLQMAGLYDQHVHVLGELGETIAVSVEKATTELGYDPQIELEEGMRRSIEWCRSAGIDI